MSVTGDGTRAAPGPGLFLAAWGAFFVAGVAAVFVVALEDLPLVLLALLPVAAGLGVAFLWNTTWGLLLVAFGVGPLNVVQAEVLTVTITFPEALILALVFKEALRFVWTGERPVDFVPWRALGLYLAASLIGVGVGLRNGNGLVHTLQDFRQFTEYFVLFLLVAHRVRTRREVVLILLAFVAGLTVLSLHAVVQKYTGIGIPGLQRESDLVLYGTFRSGSFYGATPLGALMVLCFGPALGLAMGLRHHGLRLLMLGAASLAVVAAVFTHTRASWMAMVVVVLVVFVGARKTPAVLVVSLLGALLFSAVLGAVVVERMQDLEITKTERSLRERVQYYTVAWHIFRANPVVGLGWGRYYDNTRILVNERYVPTPQSERPPQGTIYKGTVHSAYLQILVKTGLLGLVSFLGLLAVWARWMLRALRAGPRGHPDRNLFVGTVGGLTGYLFHSTFENFFQWAVMSQAFWMLLALTLLMAAQLRQDGRLRPG